MAGSVERLGETKETVGWGRGVGKWLETWAPGGGKWLGGLVLGGQGVWGSAAHPPTISLRQLSNIIEVLGRGSS